MTNKKLPKVRKGYYDGSAPKFRYLKDPFSFTRKTTRVSRGEELSLGEVSTPSQTTRGSSKFPWTKPMQGWKRVFAGYGQWRAKGRKSRKKQGIVAATVPKVRPKRKFMKNPATYGYRYDD